MDASTSSGTEIIWTLLILGAAVGTFGWMLYWAGLHVVGAFIGATAGVAMAFTLADFFAWEVNGVALSAIGMIGGGLAGILIMRAIDYWAFFLIGVALGAPLGGSLLNLESMQQYDWAQTRIALVVASVAGALLGGLLILTMRRYVIAVASAMAAAAMIALAIPEGGRFLIALLCFMLSLIVQFAFIRSFLPRDRMSLLAVSRGEA